MTHDSLCRYATLLGALSFFGCQNDVPCATGGAEKTSDGTCACPDGSHSEQVSESSKAICVSAAVGDGSVTGSRDAGGTRDAGKRADASKEDDEPSESDREDAGDVEPSDSSADLPCERKTCSSQQSWVPAACACVARDAGTAKPDAAAPACVPSSEKCDGEDNDCDQVVDNGLKNACGGPCGDAIPKEDCSTPADDNCNGQVNEGCAPASVCGDGIVSGAEKCDTKLTNTWHCAADCSAVRASSSAYTACDLNDPHCGYHEGCSMGFGSKAMCFPYKAKAGVGSCSDEIVKPPFAIAIGSDNFEQCIIGCENTGTICPNHMVCSVLPNGNGSCVLP